MNEMRRYSSSQTKSIILKMKFHLAPSHQFSLLYNNKNIQVRASLNSVKFKFDYLKHDWKEKIAEIKIIFNKIIFRFFNFSMNQWKNMFRIAQWTYVGGPLELCDNIDSSTHHTLVTKLKQIILWVKDWK